MTEGIYKIECVPTGHVYIGSSKRIEKRWIDHKSQLERGVHHSSKLQEYWDTFGSENFIHEVVELTSDLAARESHWMKEYEDKLLNASDVTFNPMRNQESVDKMLATRGDKQKGANSSSAKLNEEGYLKIVYALATTTYSAEDLSDYFGLSPRSIRDIIKGTRHSWIKETYPDQFEIMQTWRKNLRIFRATDKPAPEIELPVDTNFVEELHSFRRSYTWKTEASQALEKIQQLDEREQRKQRKEAEMLQRKVDKPKRDPWISLVNKEGEELQFFSAEEAKHTGLDVKYLTQLKTKKLIRYKGWRLKS